MLVWKLLENSIDWIADAFCNAERICMNVILKLIVLNRSLHSRLETGLSLTAPLLLRSLTLVLADVEYQRSEAHIEDFDRLRNTCTVLILVYATFPEICNFQSTS
jgi:hypothetical protein